ncbi:MAG: hypothetical protein PGN26_13030 [Xylophilus ampelinus]
MHPDDSSCKSVSLQQLVVLLEDALSAAAGWTVVPPQVQLSPARAGVAAWTVDCAGMDEALQAVVARMQQRYRVRAGAGGWRGMLARVAPLWRGPSVECQA